MIDSSLCGVIAASGVTAGDPDLISSFTLTVDSWDVGKGTGYGFDSSESAGSVSPPSIEMADGNSYTVDVLSYETDLVLSFTSEPGTISTSTTFNTFKLGSNTYSFTSGTHDSATKSWTWTSATNPIGTSGTVDCELRSD